MEEAELHRLTPLSAVARGCALRLCSLRWRVTAAANSAGRSKYMACPQSATSAYLAPGIRSAYRRACSTGISRSSDGATTSVGAVILPSRRSSFGIGQERHPAEPGERGRLPVGRDDRVQVRRGARRRRWRGGRRVVEQRRDQLVGRQQEEVGDRVLGYPQPGGGQQRQRPDAVRRVHGELGRDPAAERPAHHVRPAEPERVEHVQVVVHEVVDRPRRRGSRPISRIPGDRARAP